MKRKISDLQFFFIIFVSVASLTYFSIPTQLVPKARQDLWLSMAIGAAVDIYVAYILHWLGRKYPGQSLIQYSRTVLGPIGTLFGFIFVLFFLIVIVSAMWLFCKFLSTTLMPDTPGIIFSATMTLATGWAAYHGLESIARLAQFISVLILSASVLLILFSIRELNLHYLLPPFENGVGPAIKGAVYPASWFGICIVIGMLMPHLANPKRTFKMKASAVLLGAFVMTVTFLCSMAVIGPYMASRIDYPIYMFSRIIHLAFFERFDILLMLIYISGTFITFSTLYYGAAVGAAQLFGTRTHRNWVKAFAIFFVASPLLPFSNNASYAFLFFDKWFPLFGLLIEGGITTLIFVAALAKDRIERRR
ncbi:GerAB/ArcD/ProY family transporter [Cohnella nanjingensis]|uniref:Endospore germination permease n=1 Tax=Cohnella nanjingensis TaxID=1387779 RepID=A0A7X0VGK4_9BACL|nr:endospore germination permease [Cohnella nanjingensis]MBB6672941.1 endospore germination permease [Cohnella nanjingensis]